NGIAEARAAIARLKADLRVRSELADDQAGDLMAPDEQARPATAFTSLAIDPEATRQLLASMPLDVVPDPAPLPPRSRMPLRPNPLFVGRADDLRALAAALKSGGTAVITTGIGGVGKTQLAAEFAHRYGQFFVGGVFWLSFADPAGVDGEIA